jgi:hypothetical protein
LSFKGIFNFLLHLPKDMSRGIVLLGFGINRQQPDLPMAQSVKMDNSDAASLAAPFSRSSDLADANAAGHDCSRLWIHRQGGSEGAAFLFCPVIGPELCK